MHVHEAAHTHTHTEADSLTFSHRYLHILWRSVSLFFSVPGGKRSSGVSTVINQTLSTEILSLGVVLFYLLQGFYRRSLAGVKYQQWEIITVLLNSAPLTAFPHLRFPHLSLLHSSPPSAVVPHLNNSSPKHTEVDGLSSKELLCQYLHACVWACSHMFPKCVSTCVCWVSEGVSYYRSHFSEAAVCVSLYVCVPLD